jgi:hypothetical protein
MKNFFKRMYSNATTLNRKNILSLFTKHKNAEFAFSRAGLSIGRIKE